MDLKSLEDVENLWKHLDTLSKSDPRAYQEFIEKNIRDIEEKEKNFEKESVKVEAQKWMCQIHSRSDLGKTIYVNVFTSILIELSDADLKQYKIPIKVSPLKNNHDLSLACDVIIPEKARSLAQADFFQHSFIQHVLSLVAKDHGILVAKKDYKVVKDELKSGPAKSTPQSRTQARINAAMSLNQASPSTYEPCVAQDSSRVSSKPRVLVEEVEEIQKDGGKQEHVKDVVGSSKISDTQVLKVSHTVHEIHEGTAVVRLCLCVNMKEEPTMNGADVQLFVDQVTGNHVMLRVHEAASKQIREKVIMLPYQVDANTAAAQFSQNSRELRCILDVA